MADVYEYESPTKLDMLSGNYFVVPCHIILDKSSNDKRLTSFSFFASRRGLDLMERFSIGDIVEWTNRKQNRHKNRINDKITFAVNRLNDDGYISLYGEPGNSSSVDAMFNLQKITEQCQQKGNRFAIIYIDELKKIFSYDDIDAKDSYFNNDVVLLVFAYLRMMIYRRRNKLLPDEHDVKSRKARCPEVYNGYYIDIADDLGLLPRVVSDAVDVLNKLGLVYSEALPRVKHEGKWKTTYTLFCNRYKRENGFLLAEGSGYYLKEVENKKRQLGI